MPSMIILACMSALLLASTAAAGPQRSPWTIRGNIAEADFVIQAHRGAGELAPENTLEAFELGWKLGCYAECDLRTTSDGVIVTFHDPDFSRVVRGIPDEMKSKGVADVTWQQLARMDVGAWKGQQFTGRTVSTIAQAFERMQGQPQRRLYLDIKNVDLPHLADLVKQYQVGPQVILASTKYDQIRQWKRLIPDGQTLLWMGGSEVALTKRFDELRKINFADITQLQVHAHLKQDLSKTNQSSIDPFEPPDAFFIRAGEECRAHGILFQSLPYGGATPQVYWKLLDLGVMSFATDHPDITRAAVRDYYHQPDDNDGTPGVPSR